MNMLSLNKEDLNIIHSGNAEWIGKILDTNVTSAPYHNTEHLVGVAILTRKCIKNFLKPDHPLVEVYTKAALLHDYCYTKQATDKETIEYSLQKAIDNGIEVTDEIREIISYTQYPHIKYPVGISLKDKVKFRIIRQADMAYSTVFCSNNVVNGLFLELSEDKSFDGYVKFLHRNIKFISDLKFVGFTFNVINDFALPRAIEIHNKMIEFAEAEYKLLHLDK